MTDYLVWPGKKSSIFIAFPSPTRGGYVAGFVPGSGEAPDWENTKVTLWRSDFRKPTDIVKTFRFGDVYVAAAFTKKLLGEPTPAVMLHVALNYLKNHGEDD